MPARPALINAVLRKVSAHTLDEWLELLLSDEPDETKMASVRYAHPEWIVRAFRQSLVAHGRPVTEINDLLEADNAAPVVNLVALPGLGSLDEALESGATPGELVEGSALSSGGDLGRLGLRPRRQHPGPGRRLPAGGPRPGRRRPSARTVRQTPYRKTAPTANAGWTSAPDPAAKPLCSAPSPGSRAPPCSPTNPRRTARNSSARPCPPSRTRSGTSAPATAERSEPNWRRRFDRVLVDVPCTGLGALRRRPESRWRRTPKDLVDLGPLQRELLRSALDAVKPGGVVAYVTCSPHPAETTAVVSDALRKRDDLELLDAGAALDAVSLTGHLEAGHELTAQLWPHRHRTDAMFLALIRKKA